MAQLKLMKKEWFDWFKNTTLDNITAWTEYYYINPDSQHWISNYQLFDGEWEYGQYNQTTGVKEDNPTAKRSKNFISCSSGEYYHLGIPSRFFFYDENKNYLGNLLSEANSTFVVPTLAKFMTFQCHTSQDMESVCINKSNPTFNGHFEPYIIKIEDILGVVDLGELSWEYDAQDHIQFRSNGIASLVKKPSVNSIPKVFTTAPYEIVSPLTFNSSRNKMNLTINETTGVIHIHNPNITNAQVFKNSLKDVYMIYLKVDSPY